MIIRLFQRLPAGLTPTHLATACLSAALLSGCGKGDTPPKDPQKTPASTDAQKAQHTPVKKATAKARVIGGTGVTVQRQDVPIPQGVDAAIFKVTIDGLDALSKCPQPSMSPMRRLTECDDWKTLIKGVSVDIGAWSREPEKGPVALKTRADAAVVRLESDDPLVRLGAQRILELTLRTLQYSKDAVEEKRRYSNAMAGRLKHAQSGEERLSIMTFMANYPSPAMTEALVHVLTTAPENTVRRAAAAALSRCVGTRCTLPKPEQVEAWYAEARDPALRSALIQLAGAVGRTQVLTWCADQLPNGPLSHGCRGGLRRLGDNSAFELLLKSTREVLASDPADGDSALDLAGRIADLTPFYSQPEAKKAWPGLMEQAFDKVQKYPNAVQLASEQLGLIPDQEVGQRLLLKHYKALRKVWEKPDNEQVAALRRMRSIITRLGGEAQLDEFNEDSMPTGPDGKPILPGPGGAFPGMPPGAMPPGMMPPRKPGGALPFPAPQRQDAPKAPGGALPFPAPPPAPPAQNGALPFPAPPTP
ncbi:MAG: hypothetical protein ACE366_03450 [Bradymonadia bacterium]